MQIHRFLAVTSLLAIASTSLADEWRQFRGPGGRSVADSVSLPLEWSVETGSNVAWTADLPGNGLSSPIVVDGRVVVTAASGPDNDRLHVLAFDSATGKPLWRRQVWATGRTHCYRTSSVAAGTPATDGEQIYALFSSNDVICLDLDGNLKWIRALTLDHPTLGNDIGMAASTVVVGDSVIAQCECQTSAFAAALDRNTGATLWESPRSKGSNWTSPLAIPAEPGSDSPGGVLLQSSGGLTLYDAASGEELWQASLDGQTIPSPAFGGELVLAPTDGLSLFRKSAREMEVVWRQGGVRPGSSSPVMYGDRAYVIARGGVMTAVDLATGDTAFKRRLGGSFWATPLAADGRLYCINQEGKAFVVEAGGKGKILAENEFGEDIYGSPAAADGGMFVRSGGKLWKIATIGQARAAGGPDRR